MKALEGYQFLVNAVPGGIALYEIQKEKVSTIYYSDGMCTLSGYTREERDAICKEDAMALTYEDDRHLLLKAMDEAVRNHKNLDIIYRIKTKEGTPCWVHLNANYAHENAGNPRYYAIFSNVSEYKNLEQQSREIQMRYEVAIKSAGINIWEYNIISNSLYVISNSQRIKQNCYVIENYTESTIKNGYVREDSIKDFLSIFDRLRAGEKEITEDIWYKTTDEQGWWCERVTYTTLFDEKGTPIKAFGAGRDVTREKEAEKKFHEEMSYREIVHSINLDSVKLDLTNNMVLDGDSEYQAVKELLTETSTDAYFHKTAQYIVGKKYKARFRCKFNRTALINHFNSGEYILSMEFTRMYDSRKIYWIKYNVHLMQNPDTKCVVALIVSRDITQEKVMSMIMHTVATTDYDFLVVVDGTTNSAADYAVKTGNTLFTEEMNFDERLRQLIRENVCQEDVDRIFEECKLEHLLKKLEEKKSYKFNFSAWDNGMKRRKQLQVTLVQQQRKTFLLALVDVNNIYNEQMEAKKKLEKALKQAKTANNAKTDFLSCMSHEIRTPLNAIIGMTELAKEDTRDAVAMEKYISQMAESSKYLLGLINDVLEMRSIEEGKLRLEQEWVNPHEVLLTSMDVIKTQIKEKQIQLVFQENGTVSDTMEYYLDVLRCKQIIVNLLTNAVKYTPSNGKVTFLVNHISKENGIAWECFIVKDNGCGMSQEFMKKLFTPFERENNAMTNAVAGTGLGLSIVKRIVNAMGGRIEVHSEQGIGSEFIVTLPFQCREQEDWEEEVPVLQNEKNLKGKRILLAEDNEINAAIAIRLLEKKGMLIEIGRNGKETLEMFEYSKPDYYAAILMDIRMPIMDGLKATEEIRNLERTDAKQIPIIAMTADAFYEDIDKTKRAGMNAHLSKPVVPGELYKTLVQFL